MAIKISDLTNLTVLKALYEQRTTLALQGPPGIGKTDTVRLLPRLLSKLYGQEFGYFEECAANVDAPDVRGYMIPTKDADGKPISMFTRSGMLPSVAYLAKYPRGVYFLDEFMQAQHIEQKAFAPLLLDRCLGGNALPDGWWVITASNRMKDKSGVVRPLMHVINRQRVLEIDADPDTWCKWAEANGIHPMGITFAARRPGVVFSEAVPAHPVPFATARSFTKTMQFLQTMLDLQGKSESMELPSDPITQEMVAGDIGQAAAAEFFGFLKVAEFLPTIEEIEADPQKAKCPDITRFDAAYAAVQMCLAWAKPSNINQIVDYVLRLPKELQTATLKSLLEKHRGLLLNNPALTKWMQENGALIVASF